MKHQCSPGITLLVSILAMAATSCSKPGTVERDTSPKPTSAPVRATSDVCALLTTEDIEAVQGEAPKNTKASEKSGAGLLVEQCYFALPTPSNSIVLTVTRKAEGGRDPSQSWHDIFHGERRSEKKEEGEEKEPLKIEGVGDEAFWTGTSIGGALYVLKGNAYLRISVGGAGDQASKIEKSKTLAQKILGRL